MQVRRHSGLRGTAREAPVARDLDNAGQRGQTCTMTHHDDRDDTSGDIPLDARATDPERDGVAALHDVEAEAGDEGAVADLFDLDRAEARTLGADLDPADGGESQLD